MLWIAYHFSIVLKHQFESRYISNLRVFSGHYPVLLFRLNYKLRLSDTILVDLQSQNIFDDSFFLPLLLLELLSNLHQSLSLLLDLLFNNYRVSFIDLINYKLNQGRLPLRIFLFWWHKTIIISNLPPKHPNPLTLSIPSTILTLQCLNLQNIPGFVCNFIQMSSFHINIPSIPTAKIQFKIQNHKIKGFAVRDNRFKGNLSYLTEHFVNSFTNLHPSSPLKSKKEDNPSEISTNISRNNHKSDDYRYMVGDNKKNLIIKYQEEYKDYKPQLPKDDKYDKGFSFGKSRIKDTLEKELNKFEAEKLDKMASHIMDNYYFKTEESVEDQNQDKILLEKRREEKLALKKIKRKSAVFESQDRWKELDRVLKGKNPLGPGQYKVESGVNVRDSRSKKGNQKSADGRLIKLQKVMEMIKYLPQNPQVMPSPPLKISVEEKVQNRRSSMFAQGNLDRFGSQKFPINPHLNVPGPGAYSYSDSLQDKSNKIMIVEEQRKLLKEWFNR